MAGQSRFAFRFEGQAGTRRDDADGPAEGCAWRARRNLSAWWRGCARGDAGLVATVGQLEVRPGAGNVIPGERGGVRWTCAVRSDPQRLAACGRLRASGRRQIAGRRGLGLEWREVQAHDGHAL